MQLEDVLLSHVNQILRENIAHSDHCVENTRTDFIEVESRAVVTGVWEVREGMGRERGQLTGMSYHWIAG